MYSRIYSYSLKLFTVELCEIKVLKNCNNLEWEENIGGCIRVVAEIDV